MRKSVQILKLLVWGISVCLGGYLTARGFLYLRQSPGERQQQVMGQLCEEAEREAYAWYLPGIFYEEGKTDPILMKIWECVETWYPLATYGNDEQTAELEPVIEDESTCYEIIHAKGSTITERLLGENQKEHVTQENESARKEHEEKNEEEENQTLQEEQTAQDETQLPAWTSVVETTPSFDLSMERLSDFQYVLNNFFVVDPNTETDGSQINAAQFLQDDLSMEKSEGEPQILIYHTHSQEGYADSIEGDEKTSVIGVGDYLESILRDVYGYQVIHRKDSFDLMGGNLDRSKAYNYALPVIEQVLEENPSIQVVIDLHRDGVPEGKHLVTQINGKPTAQIMYFNGLSKTKENGALDSLPNPYIYDNLSFAFQMSYQAARYYPQFTRCIYLKGYRYNLHVRPRSILLEVGAQTNTVEEAMNAMEPFSVILDKVLKGE